MTGQFGLETQHGTPLEVAWLLSRANISSKALEHAV